MTEFTGFDLLPTTPAGRDFVVLAENHAKQFAERATEYDARGVFPFESFKEMRESGFLSASVPHEYGGLGVGLLHDLMVGMSRLARGDAGTAVAANMHIAGAAVIVQMLRRSKADGDTVMADVLAGLLSRVSAGEVLMCFPATERGTDLTSPRMEATPTADGYVLNGRKIFGTMAPVAHLFFPTVRIPNGKGGYRTASAMVPRDTPGLQIVDNWDALGMRTSGSNDITFTDCAIPAGNIFAVRDNYGTTGQWFASFTLTAHLPLIATYLGISEAARDLAIAAAHAVKGRKRLADRVPIQQLVAEIDIDLCTCRAMLQRTARAADEFIARHQTVDPDPAESNALMKEVQCTKYVVNRRAIEVVDRAMTVCGGAAYMNQHPVARLYRDVRAGPFMQPFAPYEALEYIGKVALGLDPNLDR